MLDGVEMPTGTEPEKKREKSLSIELLRSILCTQGWKRQFFLQRSKKKQRMIEIVVESPNQVRLIVQVSYCLSLPFQFSWG